ncbi:MAG: hypothetical protein HXX11_19700 [Desulfuromonadales bacterium]|nr:hypothetical protein [Desulfuromonadales bacterium]
MNMNPIPPRSIVRLKNLWPHAQRRGHKKGEIRIIGYYSKHDGLDCVWSVNAITGAYERTTDHEWLYEKFEVLQYSKETDFYGDECERIEPLDEETILSLQSQILS